MKTFISTLFSCAGTLEAYNMQPLETVASFKARLLKWMGTLDERRTQVLGF